MSSTRNHNRRGRSATVNATTKKKKEEEMAKLETELGPKDMTIKEWLEYHCEQGNSLADLLKDNIQAVFNRQVTPYEEKFNPDYTSHARRTKAVVQQFHQMFTKTIQNLIQLDAAMLKEFKEAFPKIDEDWSQHDTCSIVSSSSRVSADLESPEILRRSRRINTGSTSTNQSLIDEEQIKEVNENGISEHDQNVNRIDETIEIDDKEDSEEDFDLTQGPDDKEEDAIDKSVVEIDRNAEKSNSESEDGYASDKTVLMNKQKHSKVSKEKDKKKSHSVKIDHIAVKKEKQAICSDLIEQKDLEASIEEYPSPGSPKPTADDEEDEILCESQSLLNSSKDLFLNENNEGNATLDNELDMDIDTIPATPMEQDEVEPETLVIDNDLIDRMAENLFGPTSQRPTVGRESSEPAITSQSAIKNSPTGTVCLTRTNGNQIEEFTLNEEDPPLSPDGTVFLPRGGNQNQDSPPSPTRTVIVPNSSDQKKTFNHSITKSQVKENSDDLLESFNEDNSDEDKVSKDKNSTLQKEVVENLVVLQKGTEKVPLIDSDDDLYDPTEKKNNSKLVIDDQTPSTSKMTVTKKPHTRRNLMNESREKKKLTKGERDARREVLITSSEDDLPSTDKNKKQRTNSSFDLSTYDLKKDLKLKENAVKVKLTKLNPAILEELKNNNYITLPGRSHTKKSIEESDMESDSSVMKLDKALRDLMAFDPLTNKSRNKGAKRNSKCTKKKQSKEGDSYIEELCSADEDDERIEPGKLPSAAGQAVKKDDGNYSDLDDLSPTSAGNSDVELLSLSGEDDEKKETDVKKNSDGSGSKKKKPYVRPKIDLSSEDSDAETRDKVLKESDDDDDDSKDKTTKKKDSDDDSDEEPKVQKHPRAAKKNLRSRRLKLLSDSDGSKSSNKDSDLEILSDEDETDSESDFVKKPSRSKRKASSSDASNEGKKSKKKTKKRKRIKVEKDTGDESDGSDSDIKEVEVVPGSQRRKKIRTIISNKELQKTTREAEKDEEDRKKRVVEKQKLFNGMFAAPLESGAVGRLVLDIDPVTKEPQIEVDPSIVKLLKPHQVDGIKFLYTACFESVEQIKKGKAGGCILAHCMGLGKTLQTVGFTYTMMNHNKLTNIRTVLIVAPLNTVNNWMNEYKKWLQNIDGDMPKLHHLWDGKNIIQRVDALKTWQRRGGVGVMHYDMFRLLVNQALGKGKGKSIRAAHKEAIKSALLNPGPDMIVCDEGHLLKNCKSKLTEALGQVKTIRRIVLTGTPLQNSLIEYHTMVNFVKPNLLGNLKEFTNRFVNPIKNGQCKDSSERDVKIMKRRAHVLHCKLDGCVQRLDYSVLTPYLPPKHEYCIIIKLSDKQKALYREYLTANVSPDPLERGRRILQHYAVLIKILAHPIVLTMTKINDFEDDGETDEGSLKDFIDDNEEDVSDDVEKSTTASESDIEWLAGEKKKKKVVKRKTRSTKVDPNEESNSNTSLASIGNNLGNKWWSSIFKSKEEMYDINLSGKIVVLQEIVKTCETIGDRVLVFSQYLTTLDIIEEFLSEWDEEGKKQSDIENKDKVKSFPPVIEAVAGRWRKGIEYFRLDGSTKTDDRQKNCDIFNKKTASKAKLFLISTKAGGLGINLFGANRVVIFDASWNPSNDMQSIFRVFRFGQSKPCYIYRFVAEGTMEEKIYNRQVVKLSLSSRVVDEHQVERHFKFNDINEMYDFNPDEKIERPTPPVPKDRLLADLLISQKKWIDTYFEHDSLLINKVDEELTEEDRQQAWAEYRNENERRTVAAPNPYDIGMLVIVRQKLQLRFPDATDVQITMSSHNVVKKFQEWTQLMYRRNLIARGVEIPVEDRIKLDRDIELLQNWLVGAVGAAGNEELVRYVNSMTQQRNTAPVPRQRNMGVNRPVVAGAAADHIQRGLAQALLSTGYGDRNVGAMGVINPPHQPAYARVTPYNFGNNNLGPGGPGDGASEAPVVLD